MRSAAFAAALALLPAASIPTRAEGCSMTGYSDCVSASTPERKAACVGGLDAIRAACNAKADEAQAKMQELGSTTNKGAKPQMDSYMAALNTLYEISRAAQQLSYTDPQGLELLKNVNQDTGQQQYNMNRTFEIVQQKEKEEAAKIKDAIKKDGKTDKTDPRAPKRTGPSRRPPRSDSGGSSGGSSGGGGGGDDAGGGGGGAEANSDEAGDAEGAAKDAAAAERASAGGAKAMGRAKALGDALKAGMNTDAGAMPGGAGGKTGGTAAKPFAPGSAGGGNAAAPKTEKDLLLASVSGYGGSLAALGLVAGKDAQGNPRIMRADGSPATEADLAALKARIGGEPTALMRNPGFYSDIPRSRFMELKDDYRGRPDLRDSEFKHVGLSESERDFQRTASCSKLSGDCAPHATSDSYRKGEDVPPKELAAIHRAIHDEPESDFFDEGPDAGPPDERPARAAAAPQIEAAQPPPPAGGLRGMLAKLETMLALAPAKEDAPAGSPAAARPKGSRSAIPGLEAAQALGARLPAGRYLAGAAMFAVALLLLLRRRST